MQELHLLHQTWDDFLLGSLCHPSCERNSILAYLCKASECSWQLDSPKKEKKVSGK